jgi:hypothetical protein
VGVSAQRALHHGTTLRTRRRLLQRYAPLTRVWCNLKRARHTGSIYLVGGAAEFAFASVTYGSTYILNVAGGATSWTTGPSLLQTRTAAAVAVAFGTPAAHMGMALYAIGMTRHVHSATIAQAASTSSGARAVQPEAYCQASSGWTSPSRVPTGPPTPIRSLARATFGRP